MAFIQPWKVTQGRFTQSVMGVYCWFQHQETRLMHMYLPTPPLGQDMTKSIFKRSLTGFFYSEFSFSLTSCLTKAEEPSLPAIYP